MIGRTLGHDAVVAKLGEGPSISGEVIS